jgi:hypothetical protein
MRLRLGKLNAPQWASIALVVAALACAVVLFALVFRTALGKDERSWAKALVFVIGALAAVATVAVSWKPGKRSHFDHLLSPFGAGILLTAVFGAFGTMTSALSLFQPQNATKADNARIEHRVVKSGEVTDEVLAILKRQFPDDPPILASIKGKWGELEPACAVVWDISIRRVGDKAALIAEAIKRPLGAKPFRFVGDIISAEGDTLDVVGIEPNRGSAARFTLNGATRRLTWDDRVRDAGIAEYQPCP